MDIIYRGDGDEESEPDWVKAEREAFADHRDENGDGFMDLDEVRKWILPAGTQLHSKDTYVPISYNIC